MRAVDADRQLDRDARVAAPARKRELARIAECVDALARHRDLELDGGARVGGLAAVEQLERQVAVQVADVPLAAAARGRDHDDLGIRREHRREADAELADLRPVLLLRRAEQHQQLVLDDFAGHALALVAHGDAHPLRTGVVGQLDGDVRRAGVDRVLHELAIERVRIRELRDDVADDAAVARCIARIAPGGVAVRITHRRPICARARSDRSSSRGRRALRLLCTRRRSCGSSNLAAP